MPIFRTEQGPTLMKNSGVPLGRYVAPLLEPRNGKLIKTGERLTPPLPIGQDHRVLYERKGFRVANKADIQRFVGAEGFTIRLATAEQFIMPDDPLSSRSKKKLLEDLDIMRQQIEAMSEVDGLPTTAPLPAEAPVAAQAAPVEGAAGVEFTEKCRHCDEKFTSRAKIGAFNQRAAHEKRAHKAPVGAAVPA